MNRPDADTHADQPDQMQELHVCPYCSAEMTYPLEEYKPEGPAHWRMMLRCPQCEQVDSVVASQAEVERLDHELDRAAAAILSDLRRIAQANMSQEAEFFIRALQADIIIPTDF